MTWLKLGDEYVDDCCALSDAAFRLHTEGLSWVMKRVSGGFILRGELRRLSAVQGDVDSALAELIAGGYWTPLDDPPGWTVVHQMKHQRTPAQIKAERDRWAKAAAEVRKAKKEAGDA